MENNIEKSIRKPKKFPDYFLTSKKERRDKDLKLIKRCEEDMEKALKAKNQDCNCNQQSKNGLKGCNTFKEYLEASLKNLDIDLKPPNSVSKKPQISNTVKCTQTEPSNADLLSDSSWDVFMNTQVLRDLDEATANAEASENYLNTLDETQSVTNFRRELTQFFDEVENSICMENDKATNESTQMSTASFRFDQSFTSGMKKILAKNACKRVKIEVPVNDTFVEIGPNFQQLGPFYGLSNEVKQLIKIYKGIDELYGWQDECLKLDAVKNRKNLVYALPTSGGKTLVAEILMLREILCRKRNAIFVLPYVAIVQEKVWALSPFAVALDFLIEEYASSKGTYPPRQRRRKNSVYIATIEKALGLINSLHEAGRIDEIGLVIVDEIHLIGEAGRGATLESFLTKLIHLNGNIQIIGMSATIGNLSEICTFLNAEVYKRDFRPVELTEYIKCDKEVAKINWNFGSEEEIFSLVRKSGFNYSTAMADIDPDRLGGLVMEVIPKESCLIFCPSKKSCENVASLLCRVISADNREHKAAEKQTLRNALKDDSGFLCPVLNLSIQYGIAYHHSGLTNEERKLVEDGFREGILCVICCTSTLAAGVNLPAKRVIIRKPYIGKDFINLSRYKQMVGRAGRAGFGEIGESILICEGKDIPKVKEMLMAPMDKAVSSLHETNGKGLRHLFLSCISLGIANTRPQLLELAGKTLMAVQKECLNVDIKKLTDKAISYLFTLGALEVSDRIAKSSADSSASFVFDQSTSDFEMNRTQTAKTPCVVTNKTKLVISKFGKAAVKGSFELSQAHELYKDLQQAQESLVLLNDLHLLYLVIPYDMTYLVKPNMSTYHAIFTKLTQPELRTAKVLGLDESCAAKMLSSRLLKTLSEHIVNRFYLTLILHDVCKETPIFEVAEKYEVNRGLVQNLMTSSASCATNIVSFCEELDEFWAFSPLLKGMCERLSHCCQKDIMPLLELPSVKQNRAKQLYKAGYTTLQKVAKADPSELQKIEFVSYRVAKQLIAAAKMLLLEKVENLREEADDILVEVDDIL